MPDEPTHYLFADYVCPTHGTVCTVEPRGDGNSVIATSVRCAADTSSDEVPSICGQVAEYVLRTEEKRDTASGDPNPHPTGQAAEATREDA